SAWYLPWWATLAVVIIGAALIFTGIRIAFRRGAAATEGLAQITAGLVGLTCFVGWWGTAAHLPVWVRHPAPGIFAFVPVLAIGTVWAAREIRRSAASDVGRTPRRGAMNV